MEKHMICVLPTGDWAVINHNFLPEFFSLTTKQLERLCNEDITVHDLLNEFPILTIATQQEQQ